nr:(2Fe-2S)-binding protein [uncultured Cetobacterium sp.]
MDRDTIICYCKGIKLGTILDSINNEATLTDVLDNTGAGSSCGRCVDRIEDIITNTKKNM